VNQLGAAPLPAALIWFVFLAFSLSLQLPGPTISSDDGCLARKHPILVASLDVGTPFAIS
jgi:hypothetical protein